MALAVAFLQLAIIGCSAPAARPEAETLAIDALLSLVKARLDLAATQAREAWLAGDASRASTLDDELVDAAVNRAVAYTLPPELVREFFAAQLEAAAQVKAVLLAQWQAQTETRPKPDARTATPARARSEPANAGLLVALSHAYPILRRPGGKDFLMQRADRILAGVPGGVNTSEVALRPLTSVAH
jgi:hypothetical protein